jgi:hypothetical protein
MFGFLQVLCRKEQSLLYDLSEDTILNSGYVTFIIGCFVSEFASVCVCVCGRGWLRDLSGLKAVCVYQKLIKKSKTQ